MAPGGRNAYICGECTLRVLEESEYPGLGWFDCGDEEINDFFRNDALPHRNELLAESYVFEYDGSPVALVSLQNDSIRFDDKTRLRFGKSIGLPFRKRYHSLPAVKLGRLGVHKDFTGYNIGVRLIECCKELFVTENRTGCRFIIVDSYVSRVGFYERNDFVLLPGETTRGKCPDDTVIMYFDLKRYRPS